MIIPSIDLLDGQAVQLVGGRNKAIEAGDPLPIAERFAIAGELAVIDLDAALGQGSNAAAIEALCRRHRCRVGGGIRTLEAARRWLNAGAWQIIIGTAAQPELLRQLPRDRVIVALDARDGEVVVDGWRRGTGAGIAERMLALRDHVAGFLVTFVEQEGRMQGTHMDQVAALVEAAGAARLTIAGGITSAADIAALDRLEADAQVGMALYSGRLKLADAFAAPLLSDRPDGLWNTVIVDDAGHALGQAWSNLESLRAAFESGAGVYWSRRRGLWRKGVSSGASQRLLRIDVDCDRDCLRFIVEQHGSGFCHNDTRSCWDRPAAPVTTNRDGQGLSALARRVAALAEDLAAGATQPGSYTQRLLADPSLLRDKLLEEADELASAQTAAEVVHETADVLYFAMVAMSRAGVSLSAVERELDRRSLKVIRRSSTETS